MISRILPSAQQIFSYGTRLSFPTHAWLNKPGTAARFTSTSNHFSRFQLPRAAVFAIVTTTGVTLYGSNVQAEVTVQKSHKPNGDANLKLNIEPEQQDLINWSGTHSVSTDRYYQPETIDELKAIVQEAHQTHRSLRPVGSALSPNGLSFNKNGMINLANLDSLVSIDTKSNCVTVQAGARVCKLVEELRPYGLTLQNYASITEQQIGGLTQVGAHGTGIRVPPIDEHVVAMRLITPAVGELFLSASDNDPSLFQLARASLGLLGVVAEVTIQCVPAHKLVERTFVLTRKEVESRHHKLLAENRHLRYMWIPHTDDVIVVTGNPVKPGDEPIDPIYAEQDRLAPARNLLKSHPSCTLDDERISELHFMSLRDELLALDPINVEWVKKVNEAEAQFWRRSQGVRIDWSDSILQFDCGGQQWVSEVAFPVHKSADKKPDIQFMFRLLDMIESESIAAPAPIEQRWCAPSLSPLSPAGEKPDRELADFYSWVGIIMYLPDAEVDDKQRSKITEAFRNYKKLCEQQLWPEVHAVEHWAKIEMPRNDDEKALLQKRTAMKYPVEAFKAICNIFDPHGILRNELTDAILGAEDQKVQNRKE